MSTAQVFSAIGASNGFPFCMKRVNVLDNELPTPSEYEYWSTLSGYKKGDIASVTQAQRHESFLKAWQLFWNIESITAEANGDDGVTTGSVSDPTHEASHEPLKMVCEASNTVEDTHSDYNGPEGEGVGLQVGFDIEPIRMYKGVTTDEANFIGYGLSNTGLFSDFEGAIYSHADLVPPAGVIAWASLGSLISELGFGVASNYDYIELDGFNFVSSALGGTYDPAVPSASTDFGGGLVYDATITGINLYTY